MADSRILRARAGQFRRICSAGSDLQSGKRKPIKRKEMKDMTYIERLAAASFRIDTVCTQLQGAAMLKAAACTTLKERLKVREEAVKWSGIGVAAAKAEQKLLTILQMLGHVMPDNEELPPPFAEAEKAGSDTEVMQMLDKYYSEAMNMAEAEIKKRGEGDRE